MTYPLTVACDVCQNVEVVDEKIRFDGDSVRVGASLGIVS